MQEKYALIYRMFGGSSKVTPSLANTESRSPMLSLLKRQLMSLRDILHSPENYVADRNIYGNYAVSISPDLNLLLRMPKQKAFTDWTNRKNGAASYLCKFAGY